MCGERASEREGDIEELIEKNTRKINAFLEDIIRAYPDEWFWVHQRWGRKRKQARSHSQSFLL